MSTLPEKPSQPPAIALLKLITLYMEALENLVQGHLNHENLLQQCNSAYKRFRLRVRKTAPNFVPKTRHELGITSLASVDSDSSQPPDTPPPVNAPLPVDESCQEIFVLSGASFSTSEDSDEQVATNNKSYVPYLDF